MPGQLFTISQLKYVSDGGSASYVRDPDGVQIAWSARTHSIPVQPWEFGLAVRTVREDYPGTSSEPVEQVLGFNWDEFTLRGSWDDRWGGRAGYADEQRKKLLQLAENAQLARIAYDTISFDGIIKHVVITYLHGYRMGYSFTVSPHREQDRAPQPPKVVKAVPVQTMVTYISQAVDELLSGNDGAPTSSMAGDLHTSVTDQVSAIADRINAVSDVVSGRVLAIVPGSDATYGDPSDQPVNSVLKVAADLEGVRASAMALCASLASADATTGLVYEETLLDLLFDSWAKGLAVTARFIAVQARAAANEMKRRANPTARALYAARAGESLYDVANRFGGGPSFFRAIAKRNGLQELELDGTELLEIPAQDG